jgi:hypothetical protein
VLCVLQVELVATFAPQEERPINYNVIVRVRNKPTPLQLNVKGEGYALSPSLLLELPDDSSLELSSSGVNTVDFGQVCMCAGCTAVGRPVPDLSLFQERTAGVCCKTLPNHDAGGVLTTPRVTAQLLCAGGHQRQGCAQPCAGQPRPRQL